MTDFTLLDRRHTIIMRIFSTITSPVFSELVLDLSDNEIAYLPLEATLFRTLGDAHEIRPFKLVFLLEVPYFYQGEAERRLAEALGLVTARGLLDFLGSPPTIRRGRSRRHGRDLFFPDSD